jgi:transcriptional regulator of acetoin/glycerol metabolism
MATAVREIRRVEPGRPAPAASLEELLEEVYETARSERPGGSIPLRDWLEIAEAWRIVVALREARGNRSGAARALGIGRRTLYSKMKKLGINADWSL